MTDTKDPESLAAVTNLLLDTIRAYKAGSKNMNEVYDVLLTWQSVLLADAFVPRTDDLNGLEEDLLAALARVRYFRTQQPHQAQKIIQDTLEAVLGDTSADDYGIAARDAVRALADAGLLDARS